VGVNTRQHQEDQPFFSSIVTVSLAHFIKNLESQLSVPLLVARVVVETAIRLRCTHRTSFMLTDINVRTRGFLLTENVEERIVAEKDEVNEELTRKSGSCLRQVSCELMSQK
jgi:hypothetical protein